MIPDWFNHNFVNLDNLFIDMFSKVLPEVEVGLWTPDDWLDEDSDEPTPLLTIVRLPGGRVDWLEGYDEALIQFSMVTADRDNSNDAISVVRAVLLPMSGFKWTMSDGYTAKIISAEEVVGQQMLTELQAIDQRVVPITFRVRVGLRDRSNYEAVLRALM